MSNQEPITDSQTSSSSDVLEEINLNLEVQISLEKVVDAYNDFELAKEFYNYCNDTLANQKETLLLSASNGNQSLPTINPMKQREIAYSVAVLSQDNKFNSFANDLRQSFEAIKLAQRQLDSTRERLVGEELNLEAANKAIILEISLLFGAFVVGYLFFSLWGSLIAVVVMLLIRSSD
jgi:hypothetical protein